MEVFQICTKVPYKGYGTLRFQFPENLWSGHSLVRSLSAHAVFTLSWALIAAPGSFIYLIDSLLHVQVTNLSFLSLLVTHFDPSFLQM